MNRLSLRTVLATLLIGPAMCQTSSGLRFDIADVHTSPRADWVKTAQNQMQGGYLMADRYELRRATMLDLIRIAWNVDAEKVYAGPNWLDYDRFEIVARTKPGTKSEALRLMLQTLLEERFNLTVKRDTRATPAYLLTKGRGDLKLKAANESAAAGGCQQTRPVIDGGIIQFSLQCRNVTMDAFAQTLRPRLSRPPQNLSVVNVTGLEGTWDFDIPTSSQLPAGGGSVDSSNSILQAIEKLGLKIESGTAPQPVLMVEGVNEQPSPNSSEVARSLPPLPAPEFEVASVKPCNDNITIAPRFEAGGRVTATCIPVLSIIHDAWHLPPFVEPVGTPRWMVERNSKSNVSIVAKAPPGVAPDPSHNAEAREVLTIMLRALFIDRYKMQVHYEDKPVDTQTLVALKPRLTKADPAGRTGCTRENQRNEGRGATLKLVCRNMTMDQFAEQIEAYDPLIAYPVLNGTGIDGAWDFTISYNALAGVIGQLPLLAGRGAPTTGDGQAAEPSGSISFREAIEKQLGLKLETHKRPEPVLVIDHIEEKPVEN